jgi:hypothetical protein
VAACSVCGQFLLQHCVVCYTKGPAALSDADTCDDSIPPAWASTTKMYSCMCSTLLDRDAGRPHPQERPCLHLPRLPKGWESHKVLSQNTALPLLSRPRHGGRGLRFACIPVGPDIIPHHALASPPMCEDMAVTYKHAARWRIPGHLLCDCAAHSTPLAEHSMGCHRCRALSSSPSS